MNSTSPSSSLPSSKTQAPQNTRKSAGSNSGGSGWGGVQWGTLQGLANSVLGSDVVAAPAASQQPQENFRRRRHPAEVVNGRKSHSSGSWLGGGESSTETGGGEIRSRPHRRSAADEPNGARRKAPAHKRSTSPDPASSPPPPSTPEAEKDILAYVHHVSPTDTLEGAAIMYNIHASVLRRANGMWPNDSVQRRKTLLLPVEDCGVKGRLVTDQKAAPKAAVRGEEEAADDRDYRHESYVIIDGIGKVEIVRLARKKLSHFPPRRRKGSVSTTPGFGTPPPVDEESVFRGMTPGVGALDSGGEAGAGESFTRAFVEIAQGTGASLENVGGVIEGFVRKWTAKAQDFATHDFIELTQSLGFEIEEGGEDGSGGGSARGGTIGGERTTSGRRRREGSSTARGGGRVVRERLPRTRRERGEDDKLL